MKDQLLNIQKEAKEKIQNLHSLEDLEKFRIEFMGKKGKLTSILRGMGGLSKEERPIIGKLANEVREAIESELGKMKTSIEEKILLEKLEKDKIAMHMNDYVRIENNIFVRAVPLEIKKYFLMIGANLGSRSITAVYSNIGIIRLPEEYREYIRHFGIFASTNSLQMCSCSYGDEMVLGFTSKIPDDSIQRNFRRMLSEEEIPHRELKKDFPGCGEQQRLERKENQRIVQTFSFLCLAVAVICGMINIMTAGTLNWSWFAGAGCACAWLVVMVAYSKRRNILKNEIWQLLLISVIAILWDRFTGWRGWSVDFILPFGVLSVQFSVPVIARVNRLKREEYLFYLVQACIAGLIPMILAWTGVVKFVYPSVICAGISILTLAALFIFCKKDTLREFHKKLRM